MSNTGNYQNNIYGMGQDEAMFTQLSLDVRDPLIFNPKTPHFVLVNSYKHNQLNCFMNAVLQCIWNIQPLKQSVMEFVQLAFDDKNMTAEQRLLVEIQLLFNDAAQQNILKKESMQSQRMSEVEVEWPLLDANDLRRELFKHYYCEQQIEKFGLYAKADAAEFMQSFLELMHHCLNKSKSKKKVDDPCDPICYIHRTFQICL